MVLKRKNPSKVYKYLAMATSFPSESQISESTSLEPDIRCLVRKVNLSQPGAGDVSEVNGELHGWQTRPSLSVTDHRRTKAADC